MKRLFLAMVVAAMSFSCDGGGEDSTANIPDYAVTSIIEQTEPPKYEGFDLNFRQADYWRYEWEEVSRGGGTTYGSVTGPGTTTVTNGSILMTLGEPRTILGITFFQVLTEHTGEVKWTPTWSHIASFNNKIYGYLDGWAYLLFDAQNGEWEGGSFFHGTADRCFPNSSEKNFEISPSEEGYEVLCRDHTPSPGRTYKASETYRQFVGPVKSYTSSSSPATSYFINGKWMGTGSSSRSLTLLLVESSK